MKSGVVLQGCHWYNVFDSGKTQEQRWQFFGSRRKSPERFTALEQRENEVASCSSHQSQITRLAGQKDQDATSKYEIQECDSI